MYCVSSVRCIEFLTGCGPPRNYEAGIAPHRMLVHLEMMRLGSRPTLFPEKRVAQPRNHEAEIAHHTILNCTGCGSLDFT